jgi:hypothetical protein
VLLPAVRPSLNKVSCGLCFTFCRISSPPGNPREAKFLASHGYRMKVQIKNTDANNCTSVRSEVIAAMIVRAPFSLNLGLLGFRAR